VLSLQEFLRGRLTNLSRASIPVLQYFVSIAKLASRGATGAQGIPTASGGVIRSPSFRAIYKRVAKRVAK
jgi:hypothetical protein